MTESAAGPFVREVEPRNARTWQWWRAGSGESTCRSCGPSGATCDAGGSCAAIRSGDGVFLGAADRVVGAMDHLRDVLFLPE